MTLIKEYIPYCSGESILVVIGIIKKPIIRFIYPPIEKDKNFFIKFQKIISVKIMRFCQKIAGETSKNLALNI